MKLKDTEPYNKLFRCVEIGDWNHLITFYNCKKRNWNGWIFRGPRNSEWSLRTTIERLAIETWRHSYDQLSMIEDGLTRTFKRQYHNFSHYAPDNDDKIEWLSIMQHYGTVTRLLDCTYSFYAAVFFALEKTAPTDNPNTMSAVWAFDAQWIYEGCRERLSDDEKKEYGFIEHSKVITNPKMDNYILFNRDPALSSVYPVNPLKLNERLVIQQGVFLSPCDIKKSYIENLEEVANNREPLEHLYLILLPNSETFLEDSFRELHRMNMNSATLFPGLDGFARHLNKGLILPELIKADSKE
jgi:hypothetical protein